MTKRNKRLLTVIIVIFLFNGMLSLYEFRAHLKDQAAENNGPVGESNEAAAAVTNLTEEITNDLPVTNEVAAVVSNRPPVVSGGVPGSPDDGATNSLSVDQLPDAITTGDGSIELIKIFPGTFLMGSPDDELGRYKNEGPQTKVTLTYPFWMGKYMITVGQYLAVADGEVDRGAEQSGLLKMGTEFPVMDISWDSMNLFFQKLTFAEQVHIPPGYVFRLPTEAEWEYACRAGTSSRFSFGDGSERGEVDAYLWHEGNSGRQIHAVGLKKPNPWGLYDMHGNVNEWCADWVGKYPGGSVTNLVGTIGGSSVMLRDVMLRGGVCWLPVDDCRSAVRHRVRLASYNGSGSVGFRVVLGPGL